MTAVDTGGYAAAREASDAVARAIGDAATLIGEPTSEPVTLHTGDTLLPGLGMSEDAAVLRSRARDLRAGLFKIIVLGEFKNGKSTLLNGMLGTKLLPAKAAPSTAIITLLVYGDASGVAVYEAGKPEPRIVDWDEFVREFQLSRQDQETLEQHGTIDRFAHVEYAQIECRHPICAHGVKLIDSPGLGEHISRTRVATNFLKQAQAVIMVLNATRILSAAEREFITTVLGEGRLAHVFFVVNRINQVDEASIPDITAWVETHLARHFPGPGGAVDRDLYQRRVFFVNAKAALDARSVVPHDESLLEASGVPALERELERFLTSDEKVAAALQSSVQVLRPFVAQARRRIDEAGSALDEPLDTLERRHAEAEEQLRGLESRRAEIERSIRLFGDAIKEKVYADLRGFVDEMHETWPDDSHTLIDLDSAVSIRNVLTAYAQREAKERMTREIGEQVQRYLQIKFGQWAERIPSVIEHDVEVMSEEVEAQIGDLEAELRRIAAVFSGRPARSAGDGSTFSSQPAGILISLDDIGGITGAAMSIGDLTSVVIRLVQQAVLVFVIASLVPVFNVLTIAIIVQAINLGLHEREISKRIRHDLGERLHQSLIEQVGERRRFVYAAVEEKFAALSAATTSSIRSQVDGVRREQQRILAQKRDERFSVETEKRRLDAVGSALEDLFVSIQSRAGIR